MNKLIIFNEPVQSVRKSHQTINSRIVIFPIAAVLESITLIQMIGLERVSSRGIKNTAHFGIDPISSKYRASIADTDIKTIHLNDQQQ